jgi:hypothetical protein
MGQQGINTMRTVSIDLYASPTSRRGGIIFEAKTSTDTQSIYTCVGQLMLLTPGPGWAKVAVLPQPVATHVKTCLGEIGVRILSYDLPATGSPQFPDLPALIDGIAKS